MKRLALLVALLLVGGAVAAQTYRQPLGIGGSSTSASAINSYALQNWRSPLPTGTQAVANLVESLPLFVPADATSVQLSVANRGPVIGAAGNSATSNIAVYQSDGTGLPTGSALGLWTSQTIPGDGTILTLPQIPITRGTDGQIVLVYSVPGTINCAFSNFQGWVGAPGPFSNFVSGTTTVSPPPVGWAVDPYITFDWAVQYPTRKQRIVVLGDSLSVGCTTDIGTTFTNAAWNQIGITKNIAVSVNGLPGGTLAQIAAQVTYPYWWDEIKLGGSDVVIQAGINDLNTSLAGMQASFTTIVNYLRKNGVRRIYANTITPEVAGTDGTRAAYNAWLLANSLGLDGICDLAQPKSAGGMVSNSNANALDPAFDQGDGVHYTIAGNQQAIRKWLTVLIFG